MERITKEEIFAAFEKARDHVLSFEGGEATTAWQEGCLAVAKLIRSHETEPDAPLGHVSTLEPGDYLFTRVGGMALIRSIQFARAHFHPKLGLKEAKDLVEGIEAGRPVVLKNPNLLEVQRLLDLNCEIVKR